MADKLMYILNDDTRNTNLSIDYKQGLERFYAQLNKPLNQNSIKVPKVVKPKNKKKVIIKLWGPV